MTGRSENSRLAYLSIVNGGLLGRAYLAIYRYIYEHGPTTRNRLDSALCPGKSNPWPSRRLVEMERMGVLAVVGQDKTDGTPADLWDVTDRLPVKPPKRLSLRDRVRRALKEIECELAAPGPAIFEDPRIPKIRRLVELAEKEVAA